MYSCNAVQRGGNVTPGGSSEYKLNLFNYLLAAGINVELFVVDFNDLQESLKQKGIPFIGMMTSSQQKRDKEIGDFLYKTFRSRHFDLIHCNSPCEVLIVKKIAKECGVSVVTTLHGDNLHKSNGLKGIDGVIGVSSKIAKLLDQYNQRAEVQFKKSAWIPPFFNETKFLSFQTAFSRDAFFKEKFGIAINSDPIICSIANFYPSHKNHTVLLRAIKKIKDEYGKKVQLMLAGDGKRLPEIRALAEALGLEQQVHFLGYIDCVPELLFHSDINVLTSDMEAFGIALLEGALMSKPLIGTGGTGMEDIIEHGVTGLLFRKADERDLATHIKRLFDDPLYGAMLGRNAHDFVFNNYSIEVTLNKIITFYEDVLSVDKESVS